jgi:hypothetical protein
MTAPDAGESEPRFAGSVPAGYQPPVASPAALPTGAAPTAAPAYSPFPPPLEPEVSYSGALPPPEPESAELYRQSWLAPVLATLGGVVAIVGSVLTWATLRLVSKTLSATPDPQDAERITYNGLSLLEGRASLVVGVVAVILSVLMLVRRPLPIGLAAAGAVGVLAALFAVIAHPVDLAGLSRVFGSADDVTVRIPTGPGVWLALVGSALILSGGLVAHLWRDQPDAAAPASEQPDE